MVSEAKYGDKMSSALNIYYRQPSKLKSLAKQVLLAKMSLGLASKNKNYQLYSQEDTETPIWF